jgi:hypothetical protein
LLDVIERIPQQVTRFEPHQQRIAVAPANRCDVATNVLKTHEIALLYFKGDQLLESVRPKGSRRRSSCWFHAFPGENSHRDPQDREDANRPSTRVVHPQGADMVEVEPTPARPTSTSAPGQMLNGYHQDFGLRLCCTPLCGVRQRGPGAEASKSTAYMQLVYPLPTPR